MTEFRYRAFISYSHHDEKWASWLHKSLESYRVPRQLVGRKTAQGVVPSKLYPVFRDREELSSGSSLSDRVSEALQQSDTLIVIGSPAAVSSRWVNEEIRAFRALGRADRIFCMIIDGDPQAANIEDSCFPPALLESSEGAPVEPLAADPRSWADGKLLAKLKLVAGILGVRLDELRQREQKRRRIRQVMYGIAAAVVLGLGVTSIVLKVKETARRENAEALVSQMVDISKDLNSIVDLETQRSIAERLQGYLSTISERDLTPKSRLQVALVLRQLGNIAMSQAQLENALGYFTRSRDSLSQLSNENPTGQDELFELGQAEFWVGYAYLEQGMWDEAEKSLGRYLEVSKRLLDAEPDNAEWAMEMAYALSNLGVVEKRRIPVDVKKVLANAKSAMEFNRLAVELDGDNAYYQVELAESYANLADAWLDVCGLGEALASRIENVSFAWQFFEQDPGNNRLKLRLAFSLSGLAGVRRMVGLVDESLDSLKESIELLRQLTQSDPTNLTYRWNLHRKRASLASLLAATGKADESWLLSASIESELRKLEQEDQTVSVVNGVEFAEFLLHYSRLAWERDDTVLASRWRDEAIERLQEILAINPDSKAALKAIQMGTFQYWSQNNQEISAGASLSQYTRIRDPEIYRGCDEAAIAARLNVVQGDIESATEYTQYLLGKGYHDPAFMRFCGAWNLCNDG